MTETYGEARNISGQLQTKIINEGSGVDPKMDAKNKFKTFDHFGCQEEDISTKSVGLGLSTADALA